MKRNALGLSCGRYPTEEIFAGLAEAGIEVMELVLHDDDDSARILADGENIRRMAQRYGVCLRSLHLPFGMQTVNLGLADAEERERTLALFLAQIRGAAGLGCAYAVVHSGIPLPQSERAQCMEYAKECLAVLQTEASRLGITVMVENLLPSCLGKNSTEILELLSAHPDLRVCFDTNHLFGETHHDFLVAVGAKLVGVHLSDYDLLDERHWMPGEGKIDWPQIMDDLLAVGYDGPLLYEVNAWRTPKTIARRALTFADFRENHAMLLAGKKPLPIGKPIEAECKACVFAERYFKNFGVRYEP